MRIYFAGSAANRRYIKSQWIEPAKKKGYEISFDWTGESISNPEELAKKCINGVIISDLVVGIMPKTFTEKHAYRGTFFEFGLAWGVGIPIIILLHPEMVKFPPAAGAAAMIWAPGIRRFHSGGELWSAMETESVRRAKRLAMHSVGMGGCRQLYDTLDMSEPGREYPKCCTAPARPGGASSPSAEKSEGPRNRASL